MEIITFGKPEYVKQSSCPVCGEELDGVTGVNEKDGAVPEPGDVTICAYCGSILLFEAGNRLRLPTPEELKDMQAEQPKEFALLQKVAGATKSCIRDRRRRKYRGN